MRYTTTNFKQIDFLMAMTYIEVSPLYRSLAMNLMFFLILWMPSTDTPTAKFYSGHESMKECVAMMDRLKLEPEIKRQMSCLPVVGGVPPDTIKE